MAIERTTGTIRGRAVFNNNAGLLTPGMFARVQVPGSAPYTALLIPDVAIGSEQARGGLAGSLASRYSKPVDRAPRIGT